MDYNTENQARLITNFINKKDEKIIVLTKEKRKVKNQEVFKNYYTRRTRALSIIRAGTVSTVQVEDMC